jgi:hypothetical protein
MINNLIASVAYIYCLLYFLAGTFFLIKDRKYIRNNFKPMITGKHANNHFLQGFMYGLYQVGLILLFPIHVYDRYFSNKNQ